MPDSDIHPSGAGAGAPPQSPSAADSIALMARETALSEGRTPDALADAVLKSPVYWLSNNAFLLKIPNGLTFFYRRGQGVTYSRPAGLDDTQITLFMNSSVYGVIAWMNGLAPLVAASVEHDGRLHAFTGQAGGGKSTLAAALSKRGFSVFSDEILVLDASSAGPILGLPGPAELKLWDDAQRLAGFDAGRKVRPGLDKAFVDLPARAERRALPLGSLTFLETGREDRPSFRVWSGLAHLNHARGAFYRSKVCDALSRQQTLFNAIARLGPVPLRSFYRPMAKEKFDENVDFIASAIRNEF